jgi:hypothetical protein
MSQSSVSKRKEIVTETSPMASAKCEKNEPNALSVAVRGSGVARRVSRAYPNDLLLLQAGRSSTPSGCGFLPHY